MVGFYEHKLRSLRRNAARPAKLAGCKWLLSPRICRTYRNIPCRIRLSIASLLKISAFWKPRSLPTILAGSFSSSRLYFPHSHFNSSIRRQQAAPSASSRIGFIRALQPPQLENLRCDPAALPAHQSRTPSADKSAPWRCGRFPAPPQAAAEQIDSQLPTESALCRG